MKIYSLLLTVNERQLLTLAYDGLREALHWHNWQTDTDQRFVVPACQLCR